MYVSPNHLAQKQQSKLSLCILYCWTMSHTRLYRSRLTFLFQSILLLCQELQMFSVLVNILPGHLNIQEKILSILGGRPGSQVAQGGIP